QDPRLTRAECDVDRTVVELVVPYFVEAERDIDRRRRCDGASIDGVEIGGERAGGDRAIANAALEEVAGQRALGPNEHVGARAEWIDLGENRFQPLEIAAVIAFPRLDLGHGEVDERGHATKGSAARTTWARFCLIGVLEKCTDTVAT